MNKLVILVIFVIASSCSTYSKNECLVMDQTALGYKDGSTGVGSYDVSLNHFKSTCEADHGIHPDVEKIKAGYESGIRFYCSSEGADKVGRSGKEYTGVCPKELEKVFLEKYNPARMSFLEIKVKELEKEITNLEDKIRSEQSKTNDAEYRARAAETKAASCIK